MGTFKLILGSVWPLWLCFMALFVPSAKARLKRFVELKKSLINIMKKSQLRLNPGRGLN